ncbi:hypothetical protein Xbed_01413 [Xenorhabdus beddingii]|uniref:Type IV pilus biogenesis protein PilO n=1 Tax=Xenorhabdus beddingii TaxID=40578 RepID=A0A1Y2SRZ0_9GAMM|nr:hypothetical protein [Xenorhabdus beddingii]OTA20608.1 hypothetical protein Xbed_01413 [Xenorhabdus beddingii]
MKNNYLEWFHWPTWLLFLLQQLLTIPLLLGFYFLAWQDHQYEIQALQSNITEHQHNTMQYQQRIAALPSLHDTQQKIQRITTELGQDTQATSKPASVLKRLHMPLIHSSGQLIEWKTHKENNQLFWHIKLSLNYAQFLHFLDEIQQLQPPLLIKHLTITPADDWLTVRMVLSDIPLPETTLPEIAQPDRIQPASAHERES